MRIVTKDYFCNRCIDGNKRDYAFDCSICLFTPDTPEPTNFQARPVIVDEMVQYLTEKDKENLEWVYKISKGAAEMQKKTLTFVDNNGVTLYGDIPAEVIKKQRTENGKAEKLLKHLSDDEIAFVKANPSILENLGKQANNPLYKRATQEMQRTKSEQLVKAAEKYPEPLNPDSWTGAQLADHAFQEVFDLTSYVTGMKIKFETMQDIIDDLDARYNETADDARILDNKNKMIIRQAAKWKKKYKQALAGIDKAKEDGNFVINNLMNRNTELCSKIVDVNNALDRAATNLAKQQITIENLQKQPTIAVNENFALQAKIEEMKHIQSEIERARDRAQLERDGFKNRIDAYVEEIGILNNKVEQAEKIALYHQEEVKNSAEKFLKKHHDFVMLEKKYETKIEEITVKDEMIEQLEQRYKESVQTIDELTQHKSKLLSNATRYKKEMQDAQSKLSGYELMKEKNEKYKAELDSLDEILKQYKENEQTLIETRNELQERYEGKCIAYDGLLEKTRNIRMERDDLVQENNDIREENEKLQELNVQLCKDNKVLEDKVCELFEKNERLEKQYNLLKRGHDCEKHQVIQWQDNKPVVVTCEECGFVIWSADNEK